VDTAPEAFEICCVMENRRASRWWRGIWWRLRRGYREKKRMDGFFMAFHYPSVRRGWPSHMRFPDTKRPKKKAELLRLPN